jgi:hypothetical protein
MHVTPCAKRFPTLEGDSPASGAFDWNGAGCTVVRRGHGAEDRVQTLTTSQVASWRRGGFLSPVPLLSEAERRVCPDGLARFEGRFGQTVNATNEIKWRTMPYLLMPWAARLARDARILDGVVTRGHR